MSAPESDQHSEPTPTERAGSQRSQQRIFLCHSKGDKTVVRDLYHKLKKAGFSPWLDEEDILAGKEWDQEIRAAVRTSRIVLACLSSSSITKEGYVQREIRLALDVAEQKPPGMTYIIPIRLDNCTVPERLDRWQWIDLFVPTGYDKLLQSLDNVFANKTTPVAAAPAPEHAPQPDPNDQTLPERDARNTASSVRTDASTGSRQMMLTFLIAAAILALAGYFGTATWNRIYGAAANQPNPTNLEDLYEPVVLAAGATGNIRSCMERTNNVNTQWIEEAEQLSLSIDTKNQELFGVHLIVRPGTTRIPQEDASSAGKQAYIRMSPPLSHDVEGSAAAANWEVDYNIGQLASATKHEYTFNYYQYLPQSGVSSPANLHCDQARQPQVTMTYVGATGLLKEVTQDLSVTCKPFSSASLQGIVADRINGRMEWGDSTTRFINDGMPDAASRPTWCAGQVAQTTKLFSDQPPTPRDASTTVGPPVQAAKVQSPQAATPEGEAGQGNAPPRRLSTPDSADEAAEQYRKTSVALTLDRLSQSYFQECSKIANTYELPEWKPVNEITRMISGNRGDLDPFQRVQKEFPDSAFAAVRILVAFKTSAGASPMHMSYVLIGKEAKGDEIIALFDADKAWKVISQTPTRRPDYETIMRKEINNQLALLNTKIAADIKSMK